MVDTVGQKLKQARQRKQLSLEEVARATKIRVPRLADIENDDYTNFPSMAYVRGFIFIYAKYLGVDISQYADSLGSLATSVGIGDYEYLSNAPDPAQTVVHRKLKRRIWPLVAAGILLVSAVVALVAYNFVISAQRLGNLDALAQRHQSENAAEKTAPAAPSKPQAQPQPAPELKPKPRPAQLVIPAQPAPILGEESTSTAEEPAAADSPAPIPQEVQAAREPEVRRAIPVHPTAPSTAVLPPAPDLSPKEVTVRAIKKTWVKITKDSLDSPPIYEDWLYPDTLPLRLRGIRFFIQMSDPAGLRITRNGEVQPIEQPSIIIQ